MLPSLPNLNLSGKVAVITGGGRGIGQATALRLAAAGAKVAVAARSENALLETVEHIREAGGQALPISVDVTDYSTVEKLIERVNQTFGGVDILVNNAGEFGPIGPMWEAEPEAWWRTLEVNLHGAFLCARAVLPGMIGRGGGCIVNLASSVAVRHTAYSTAYSVSKAALVHLTGCLALETQAYGVSVFAIHPGTVLTDMTRQIIETEHGKTWLPRTQKTFEEGRNFPPERAAELVLYLASGAADRLSGRYLQVTDDIAEMVRQAEEG
jgi:NAD(P)-dependent dehydrogenase (short-subunit alcohol dehydrogenase family)